MSSDWPFPSPPSGMPQRLSGRGSFRMVWNGTVRVTEAWGLPLARTLFRSAAVSLESVGAAGWPPSCRTGSSCCRTRTRRGVTPETPLFRRGLELTGQPAVCRPSLPARRARGSAPAAGKRLRGKHPSGRGGTGRQGPPSRWGPMARGPGKRRSRHCGRSAGEECVGQTVSRKRSPSQRSTAVVR